MAACSVLALCLGWVAPARGQVPAFSTPRVLNAGAQEDQARDEAPRIATDGAGVWVSVWQSRGSRSAGRGGRSLGRDWDILYVRSADGGSTWTAPAPMGTFAYNDTGQDVEPALATDSKGTWVVVWSSTQDMSGGDRHDRDLQFVVSHDNAKTWSEPRYLNINAERDWGDDETPDIATDGSGRWVVVWESTDSLGNTIGGDRDVLVSDSSDDGASWSAPAPLDKGATSDLRSDDAPRVGADGRGHWVVAWSSGGPSADGLHYNRNIRVAVSEDKAVTWKEPVYLGDPDTQKNDQAPRLATDGNGHWLCAWSSTNSFGGRIGVDRDVIESRSADEGRTWTEPRPLSVEAERDAGDDSSPTLAADGKGSWVAVWTTWDDRRRTAGGDGDLLVSMSRDYGETWTPSQLINPNATDDYGGDLNPSLATDRRGLWLLVWDANEPADGAMTIGVDRDLMVASGRFGDEIAGPPPPTGE